MKKGRRSAGYGKRKTAIIIGLAVCAVLLAVCCVLVVKIIRNLQQGDTGPAQQTDEQVQQAAQTGETAVIDATAVLKNETILGVNVDGMTFAEAEQAILKSLSEKDDTLEVRLPDRRLRFSGVCTWTLEGIDELLERVYTSDEPLEDPEMNVELDKDAIMEIIDRAAQDVLGDSEPTTYKIEDDTLLITVGTAGRTLDTEALYEAVAHAYETADLEGFDWDYEEDGNGGLDLQELCDRLDAEASDAEYDPETNTIIPETTGYSFDTKAAQKLLDEAEPGETIRIAVEVRAPEITEEALKSLLFRDLLSSVDASQSSSSNRANNLARACEAVNGTILMPDEVFSFNDATGKRTTEKGYKEAGAYSNGETVQEVGGGVCQVASSIYYAALKANLKIVERTMHMFMVGYVPLGMDATVNYGTLDMKFRNSTDYPIRIEASAEGGTVHIRLYGTNIDGSYVKMTSTTTDIYEPKTVYKLDTSKGEDYNQVTTSPSNGCRVVSFRNVYAADGTLISSVQEAVSTYQPHNKTITIGKVPEGKLLKDGELTDDPDYVPQPEEPEEAVDPSQSTETVEPDDSGITPNPTEADGKPTVPETTKPEQPTQPTEPTQLEQPTEPTEPGQPTEPEQPTQPEQPTEPSGSSETGTDSTDGEDEVTFE